MARMELPYSKTLVKTKKQGKEFFNAVLMPAADIAANCSFAKSGLYQVSRTQDISCSEEPGDWAEIGFRAVRLDPQEYPRIIQCNIWAHNATDTGLMPLPEAALAACGGEEPTAYIGGVLLSPLLEEDREEEDDDEDEDSGFEDEVIEQHDFYLDNQNYRPVRELDYVFTRDGVGIWQESHSESEPTFWVGDSVEEQRALLNTELRLRQEFDALDLKIIGGVLGRLGLLRA